MKKLLFFFLCHSLHAQMNMDSLENVLFHSGQYHLAKDKVKYLMASYDQYVRNDGLDNYDVHLDSNGHLADYINVAAVYHQFDDKGRLLKMIGYNQKGEYSLQDFPPITIYEYRGDTTKTFYYSYKKEPRGKRIVIKDAKGRKLSESYYEKEDQLTKRETIEYVDAKNETITKYYGSNNKLELHWMYGAAIVIHKYDRKDSLFLEEVRYYDTNNQLIDDGHNKGIEIGFCKVRYKKYPNGTAQFFYNVDNKLVYEYIPKKREKK